MLDKKIGTDYESLEFLMFVGLNLKTIKFYLIKLIILASHFYWQPSYLLDETSPLKVTWAKNEATHNGYALGLALKQ
jgi:hypothetical protein